MPIYILQGGPVFRVHSEFGSYRGKPKRDAIAVRVPVRVHVRIR